MIIFLLLAAYSNNCPAPKLLTINSKVKLEKRDYRKFNELKKTHKCAKYYKDAPCLKTVIKVESGMYRVLCGN